MPYQCRTNLWPVTMSDHNMLSCLDHVCQSRCGVLDVLVLLSKRPAFIVLKDSVSTKRDHCHIRSIQQAQNPVIFEAVLPREYMHSDLPFCLSVIAIDPQQEQLRSNHQPRM